MEPVYEPREDSALLLECLKKIKIKRCRAALDLGTGSGILAFELVKLFPKAQVYASDINPEAEKKIRQSKKIKFILADLLAPIKTKFDLIIFNPPYLPEHKMDKSRKVTGGKHGYETVEKFIRQLPAHLSQDGKCLLLISSLTRKKHIERCLSQNKLRYKIICKRRLFFEQLFVYAISL